MHWTGLGHGISGQGDERGNRLTGRGTRVGLATGAAVA
jgi:hypothetical protein